MELCHIFWHPWVGTRLVSSTLQHPSCREENPRSGLTEGAVTELQLFLKLQSLVVLGGKWLPFSLVGGIPMFVKEPTLVAYKQIPKLHGKEAVMSDQVVCIISLSGPLHP